MICLGLICVWETCGMKNARMKSSKVTSVTGFHFFPSVQAVSNLHYPPWGMTYIWFKNIYEALRGSFHIVFVSFFVHIFKDYLCIYNFCRKKSEGDQYLLGEKTRERDYVDIWLEISSYRGLKVEVAEVI